MMNLLFINDDRMKKNSVCKVQMKNKCYVSSCNKKQKKSRNQRKGIERDEW